MKRIYVSKELELTDKVKEKLKTSKELPTDRQISNLLCVNISSAPSHKDDILLVHDTDFNSIKEFTKSTSYRDVQFDKKHENALSNLETFLKKCSIIKKN